MPQSLLPDKEVVTSALASLFAVVARQVDPPEDIEVPQSLLPDEEVERLVAERSPRFVPLERFGPGSDPTPPPDPASGAARAQYPFAPCLL